MGNKQQDIWERYVASWKAASREEKRELLRDCLAADCVYTDPLAVTKGHDQLLDYMLSFHEQVPGGHFVTKYFLAHHGVSIAKWEMRGGDGSVLGDGVSYAEYTDAGQLKTMTGFFDTP